MATCSTHNTTSLHSPCTTVSNTGFRQKQVIFFTSNRRSSRRHGGSRTCFQVSCSVDKPVVIGLAADSGCGKSTFMHRLTSVFGGAAVPPKGRNPDSNTLISDTTTVICLDDYHSLDRNEPEARADSTFGREAPGLEPGFEVRSHLGVALYRDFPWKPGTWCPACSTSRFSASV
jgi:hypothetical protein